MSRTIELREVQQAKVQAGSPAETQTDLWADVMRAMGYPESWGEEISARLAAKGKVWTWTKVSSTENR